MVAIECRVLFISVPIFLLCEIDSNHALQMVMLIKFFKGTLTLELSSHLEDQEPGTFISKYN